MKSRLYTRTGDDGSTSLVGGRRAPKDCDRLEAYGTVDELNSWLGMLTASPALSAERREQIQEIQNRLFDIGAILATDDDSEWRPDPFPAEAVDRRERLIDEVDGSLPPLRRFVLPGGHPEAARANVARTVARRAERRIVALARVADVDAGVMRYINRLSDFLFTLGREINIANSVEEIFWKKNEK